MSPGITELQLTDVSTISIPTDAILILSLLLFLALIGYFFQNIIDNQTNQFIEKVDDNSHLKLVKEKPKDHLTLESKIEIHKKSEKQSIKKLDFLPPTKFLGIGSMAVLAIGGSSLLRIQSIQNSYKGVTNSPVNIKLDNQASKSILSMAKVEASKQSQTKIKKISYIDPLLSTDNISKKKNFPQVRERQLEDFFTF